MAELPAGLRKVLRFWEWPFLAALAGFMFWVRMLPYDALVGGGRVYFIGTDPFYHFRETLGIVRSFPRVPRYDPFTFYPNGTTTGQFGSLFDWLAAAFVVVTKGKGASEQYVAQVLGVFPAVLGALMVIPFYFLARRLLGKSGAVVASIALALLPGEFLIRSVAGYSDHHVAEALFSIVSILGVLVAVDRFQAVRGALAHWRRVGGYWKALAWGALGGVALAANFYAWPPAVLFLGILTVWLTIVIVLENAEGGDAIGYVAGAGVVFVTAGILMVPTVENTFLGEFNTYGILQPAACFLAALWLAGVHAASAFTAKRGLNAWIVPGAIVGLALVALVVVQALFAGVYGSLLWGLSWVTGIGVQRTTLTIAEARPADFFCTADAAEASCLGTDFGVVPAATALILMGLLVWTLVKRRPHDVLLLTWSLVVFRATDTQVRFSYYLAVNMALLLGWLAARVAEGTGLERFQAEPTEKPTPAPKGKGRRTRATEAGAQRSRPLQVAAVAAVLILLIPGNVLASNRSVPGWKQADIRDGDYDLKIWMDGLDWMRANTPDAGVDLGAIIERPEGGKPWDYPPNAYGVLSWWDYGHWIETIAQRPPVANPFQQAAPFASTWFTERDPARAEQMLDDWVQDKGPVRYVFIDDEMATGKYGAITVWARSQNASRDQWPAGDYTRQVDYSLAGATHKLYTIGPQYTESMMGRLYDQDGDALAHYRLVWEHPIYSAIGNIVDKDGGLRCFHDTLPSRSCPYQVDGTLPGRYQPGTTVQLNDELWAYDLGIGSRLKLYERVEGARLVGTAQPNSEVSASVEVFIDHGDARRSFLHTQTTRAGPDGSFEIVWPYSTTAPLPPEEGGTNLHAKPLGPVRVTGGGLALTVDVPDRAVLDGEDVRVGG